MAMKTEQKLQLGGVSLIIIGFFLAFIIGYFVQGFPSVCSFGGFILLLIGGVLVALGNETNKKRKADEKKLLNNSFFIGGVFLFVGICMILVSVIGIYLGDFTLVWEEPLLYSAIGICLVIIGIYICWRAKK